MRKLFILTISLILVSAMTVCSHAADLNISFDENVKAGETFELTVTYQDENLDAVKGNIEYDDQMLEYVSGGASTGNGGIISIDSHSDDGKTISEKILFEAKTGGQTNIRVTTEECYDLDGNVLNNPWVEQKIVIGDAVEKKSDEDKEKDKETLEKEKQEQEAQEKAQAEERAIAQARAEKEALEKAQKEQQEKNSRMQFILIGITFLLLIIAGLVVSKRRKKRRK